MMSCAECHLWVDYNIVFRFGHICMECTVNHATVSDYYWLEEVLFPFLVPVLILCLYIAVSDLRIGQRKISKRVFYCFFIAKALLDIS